MKNTVKEPRYSDIESPKESNAKLIVRDLNSDKISELSFIIRNAIVDYAADNTMTYAEIIGSIEIAKLNYYREMIAS